MAGRKLSREETEKRRASLRAECRDYVPTRGGHQCQHYAGKGACKHDDYFMCVVWAKRHPEQMYHLQQRERPRAPAKQEGPPPQPEAKYPDKKPSAQVHDLSAHGVRKHDDGRHLLEHPELLTEEAIDALCKLGIEVMVKTATGT